MKDDKPYPPSVRMAALAALLCFGIAATILMAFAVNWLVSLW